MTAALESCTTMQPQALQTIESSDLERVNGGFLAALLGAAPGILQGVTGLIGQIQQGKAQKAAAQQGGPGPGAPGPGSAPGSETAAAAQRSAGLGAGPAGGSPGPSCSSSVSITYANGQTIQANSNG
jgi:hypothetical protein